jgi:hypothetical protein
MKHHQTARPGALATRSTYHYGKVARDGQHEVEYIVRCSDDRSQQARRNRARRYWFEWAWEPGKVITVPEENP